MNDRTKPPPTADILSLVQGGDQDEFEKAMAAAERNAPRFLRVVTMMSHEVKIKFDALKKEGFTDQQALQLTMKWMWP